MSQQNLQAVEVIVALRNYRDRLDEMLNLIDDKKMLRSDERSTLQDLLRVFKDNLKEAAKRGTVGATKKSPNQFETYYFEPAVSSAAANLTVAVNTDPIRSKWYVCLYGVRSDITDLLGQLEKEFPGT